MNEYADGDGNEVEGGYEDEQEEGSQDNIKEWDEEVKICMETEVCMRMGGGV